MRIKIRLNVRNPLTHKKKITRKNGTKFVVQCKYERLGKFCFVCGMLTHTNRLCRKFLDSRGDDSMKDWGNWLCAPSRRGRTMEK